MSHDKAVHNKTMHDIRHVKRHRRREKARERRDRKRHRKHHGPHPDKKKSRSLKFWIIVLAIGVALVVFREALHPFLQTILNMFEDFISRYATAYEVYTHIKDAISTQSILGVGYVMLLLSLFFIPAPIEAVFVGFMLLPHDPFLLVLVSTVAGTLGHVFNYIMGFIFGRWILRNSKDKTTGMMEWFYRSGGILLFIFNFLPLPSQPASVVYGFTKYSLTKFTVITFLGRLLKFTSLMLLFEYARPVLENIPLI